MLEAFLSFVCVAGSPAGMGAVLTRIAYRPLVISISPLVRCSHSFASRVFTYVPRTGCFTCEVVVCFEDGNLSPRTAELYEELELSRWTGQDLLYDSHQPYLFSSLASIIHASTRLVEELCICRLLSCFADVSAPG